MKRSIAELLEGIADNDSRAFEELSSMYGGMMYSLVGSFVSEEATREDIEDLEQEAKVLLLNAARTYDPASGLTFGLYAKICVKNGLITLSRKKKNEIKTDAVDIDELNIAVPDTTIDVDESESASQLLDRLCAVLSENETEVLKLRIDGFSNPEISARLGISVKSVENSVFRIKQKLRTIMS